MDTAGWIQSCICPVFLYTGILDNDSRDDIFMYGKEYCMRPLKTGVAYHGNRMLHHAEADLRNIAAHNMNVVVHMFSHTDWERHHEVMRRMFAISKDVGLEVWVDNWGLGGPPGDKSHFLSYHPDSHVIMTDGTMDPVTVCLHSPDFHDFMRRWIEAVADMGAETIFWDEPRMPVKWTADGKRIFSCACPRCQKLFAERYGKPMAEAEECQLEDFQLHTITEYLRLVTDYAAEHGLKNAVCVMLGDNIGINLESSGALGSLPHLDNIGSDPYWGYRDSVHPYEFVYNGTKRNLEISAKYGKDHNIWIQAYATPRGKEEEIVVAAEAAYDAGARTILGWSYYAGISNDYGAQNAELAYKRYEEAMARIWNMERDRILEENRRLYRK